jgi:hypothetical protein
MNAINLFFKRILSYFLFINFVFLQHLSAQDQNAIQTNKSEIIKAQKEWANRIINIGEVYLKKGDYLSTENKLIDDLYAYNFQDGSVLFKPTRASKVPFRVTKNSALSYFVGNNTNYPEDFGFAINPWKKITFQNKKFYFYHDISIAMGIYNFTDLNNNITKVEYTFGYIKTPEDKLKIILHHSSLPYTP